MTLQFPLNIRHLDKSKQYCIVGCHKCGTVSLETFLLDYDYDVIREEQLFTRGDGYRRYKTYQKKRIPIIILRNPIIRSWSHYRYFNRGNMKTPGFNLKSSFITHSRTIQDSNYKMFLPHWEQFNPIVFILEILQRLPDFPNENINVHITKQMTREESKMIQKELQKHKATYR